MAKFTFRLATLLRLRETDRDRRRTELAEAYRADEIIHQHRRRVAGELRVLAKQARQAAGPGELDVDQLLEARRYEMVLRSQDQQLAERQQAVQAEIDQRRQALVEANREVRVLETLREKQREHHRRQENRREIKQLDETAARRHVREDDL